MAGVTIFALISYFVTPESAWLPIDRISHFIDSKSADVHESVEEVGSGDNHRQPEATTSSSGREEN